MILLLDKKTSLTFCDATKLLATNIAINTTFPTIARAITHAISSTEPSNKAQHAREIFCDTYAAVIEPETINDAIGCYKKLNTYSQSLRYYQTPKSCLSHPHDSTRIQNFKKIQHYLANNSQPKNVLNWSLEWTLDQYPQLRGQLLGNQS